jgi:hypothetical protein
VSNKLVIQTLTLADTTAGYTGPNEFSIVSTTCPAIPNGVAPLATCTITMSMTANGSNGEVCPGASITGTLTIYDNTGLGTPTAGSPTIDMQNQVVNLTGSC